MARREYVGGAGETTITGTLAAGGTSITIANATGWPDANGGTTGFTVDIDFDNSKYEKILCTNRVGTTLTLGTRGYDDTSDVQHESGAKIRHVGTAIDLDEANAHINNTANQHSMADLSDAAPATEVTNQLLAWNGSAWVNTSNPDVPGTLDVTGATTLDSTLSVASTTTFSDDVTISNSATPSLTLTDTTNNADHVIEGGDASLTLKADANAEAASSIIGFEVDGSEVARFDANGRLGIGTTSPAADLHISSATPEIRLTDETASAVSSLTVGDVGSVVINADTGNTGSSTIVQFNIDAVEVARFDRGGASNDARLGVNTTPYSSRLLSVLATGGAGNAVAEFRDDDSWASASTAVVVRQGEPGTDTSTSPTGTCNWISFENGDGVFIAVIEGDGAGGAVLHTSSDIKLKDIIKKDRPLDAGAIIDNLKVEQYTIKENPDLGPQMGLIAQDAMKVLPKGIARDRKKVRVGDEEKEAPAGIDYSKVVPILIAECQSLRKRVAELEAG